MFKGKDVHIIGFQCKSNSYSLTDRKYYNFSRGHISLITDSKQWLHISFCRQFTPGPVATGYRLLYLNYGLLDMSLLLWYRN